MPLDLVRQDADAVVASLVGSALALPAHEAVSLTPEQGLDALGVDSLDLIGLATRVAGFFRLHESETEDALLRRRVLGAWAEVACASWPHTSRRLSFHTSGTTGQPVECVHPFTDLAEEAQALASLVGEGRRRVVGLVPRHHIYGFLFTVLLPRALGVEFLDARAMLPTELQRALRPGDVLVGFPTRWSQQARPGLTFPPGVVGTTSTAPCPAEVADSLVGLGLERLIEVYGSSETAGIGWRDAPERPFCLFPWWTLSGGRLHRSSAEDRLRQGPPVVPPDVLEVEPGGFRVRGRRDGMVQVGGVNVSLTLVEAVLRTHPQVADCVVRLMRLEEGIRLKAFVVSRDTGADVPPDVQAAGLRRWLAQRLPVASRPTALTVGTAIPRDPLGKPADW